MAFKLLLSAETRWRRVTATQLVALVQGGAGFPDGKATMLQTGPEPEVERTCPAGRQNLT